MIWISKQIYCPVANSVEKNTGDFEQGSSNFKYLKGIQIT